jgi:CNT family concentrative nucleoside transporter
MPQKLLTFLGLILISFSVQAQSLTDTYHFKDIKNTKGQSLLPITQDDYLLIHGDLTFSYFLTAKNDLTANGTWQVQDNILVFDYSAPNDTTRYYEILELSDSILSIKEGNVIYRFNRDGFTPQEEVAAASNVVDHFKDGGLQLNHVLRGILGLFVLLLITYVLSSNRKAINWGTVLKGLSLQLILAVLVLKVPFVERIFDSIGKVFVKILSFTAEGSKFLFSGLMDTETYGFIFAFQVLPTVIFFSALTSILYYYGILQKVVWAFAWVMRKTLKLSGAESLAAAGNIFLGQTEAPLLVKPYIKNMTLSELLCLMSGGMATIAGAVLAAYIGFLGGPDELNQLYFAKHLLTASVMSAPAAIIAAKILLPETEKVNKDMTINKSSIGGNWLEAIANGTTEGLKLAVNVGAMLLVFTAFIALANSILGDLIGDATGLNGWVADLTDGRYDTFSLEFILGYTLSPLTWLLGVSGADAPAVGQLLGEKTILNEFYAYTTMSNMVGEGMFTDSRSIVIATYILCGFSNFASIGIQIGGIGAIAPTRRGDLSKLGVKALIAGTMASLYTGVIVGMLI